jgi:hypothetical protein
MEVRVKTISDDEVILETSKFIFKIRRRYVRVDVDTWYNKNTHNRVTFEELTMLSDTELIYGKEKKCFNPNVK